ncbi:MAG: polysaccharide deacetylase family protein [Pseudomonadota bacterium]
MHPVYMYHGVGSGAELDGADPSYAVSSAHFKNHLRAIGRSVPPAHQLRRKQGVVAPAVTFDDGHITNFTNAFPALLDAAMTAEFYVNTAMIGRAGFVNWRQLEQMAQAGMSIQSHGHCHVFLADLDETGLRAELERSKKTIEDRLGHPVATLAPPGGRYDRRTVETARALGYRALAVSRPGLWRRPDQPTVPRFPVYASTNVQTIKGYLSPWSRDALRAALRYRAARLGQRLIGNRRYDALRDSLLGGAALDKTS